MRTQRVVLLMLLSLSLICGPTFAGNGTNFEAAPASTSCWVAAAPDGDSVSVVGDADGIGDRLGWLRRSGPLTTNLKFILKFKSGSPIVKSVQQFRNVNGTVSAPFSFPYWFADAPMGPANVTVKDD